MRFAILSIIFAVFGNSALLAQTTVTVGPPSSGATYQSIYAALNATASLPRPVSIQVQSMIVASSGNYLVLSESTGEVYPLNVPADTTIVGVGSIPVYIGTEGAGSTLIKIDPAGAATGTVTLGNLRFFGCDTAVHIIADSPGEDLVVTLRNIEFSKNRTALLAEATGGGHISALTVGRSRLRDEDGSQLHQIAPIQTFAQEYGLVFRANGAGAPDTRIVAHVLDFTMDGIINLATGNGGFDQVTGDGQVIRVEAIGATGPSEYIGSSGSLTPSPVPHVEVNISGGELHGYWKTGGWKTGVYCLANGAPDPNFSNYNCSFEVEIYGTKIHEMSDNGVVAETDERGRGDLTLNGNAQVYNTNEAAVVTTPDWFGAGVVGLQKYGFLAVRLFGETDVRGNKGDGVYLRSRTTEDQNYKVNLGLPEGLYVEMSDAKIHSNSGDGVHATAGGTTLLEGVVGGGRSWVASPGGGLGWYYHHPTPDYIFAYQGQGFINRCQIHNNGGRGVHYELIKRGVGSLRLVNSILWNNRGAGWFADLSQAEDAHALCCPVVYCTLAGNGWDMDYATLDIVAPTTPGVVASFYKPAYPSTLFPAPAIHTKFLHSAFQRKTYSNPDFGPGFVLSAPPIVGNIVKEATGALAPLATEMSALGCRSGANPLLFPNTPITAHEWSTTQVNFAGTINWIGDDPTMLYIPIAGNVDNDEVVSWDGVIPYGSAELVVDFGHQLRDAMMNLGVTAAHTDVRGAKTE